MKLVVALDEVPHLRNGATPPSHRPSSSWCRAGQSSALDGHFARGAAAGSLGPRRAVRFKPWLVNLGYLSEIICANAITQGANPERPAIAPRELGVARASGIASLGRVIPSSG